MLLQEQSFYCITADNNIKISCIRFSSFHALRFCFKYMLLPNTQPETFGRLKQSLFNSFNPSYRFQIF